MSVPVSRLLVTVRLRNDLKLRVKRTVKSYSLCAARYHLRDVILGSVHFSLASADIDKVAIQILRRETTNKPGLYAVNTVTTLTSYYLP